MAKKEKPERRESEPTPHHENHHADARRNHHAKEAAPREGQPTPLTVSAPPPHPGMNVYRVLKQAFRDYHSGPGATFTVATPAGQAHTATLAVSGTIDVDPTVLTLPADVSVSLTQAAAVVATRAAPVTPGNPGTYTTTFPANTLAAGAATATASSIVPLKTATTASFTMT